MKDAYFTKARFDSICPETGKKIKKGDTIAYFPYAKKAYHENSKNADIVRNNQFNKVFCMGDAHW